jgi:hypothetical protein
LNRIRGYVKENLLFLFDNTSYQVYGDGHTDLDDLAASSMAQGKYDEAELLYRRTLAIAREESALVYVYACFTTLPISLTVMNILKSP